MPTSTPTPTSTPVPVVKLVLDAVSNVAGYWSDGTADVEVTATLRNEGTLRLDGAREITATCIAEGDERRACREELSLSLPDGFAPASDSFTLRLPMGATTLELDYGESEPMTLDIEVPERILGVDREVWECYIDRPPRGWDLDKDGNLCGTMTSIDGEAVVEKWVNDVPIKVWATGDPLHVSALESALVEISVVSGLEFEWVDSEANADFSAYVGLSENELLALDQFDSVEALHGWGGLATWRGRRLGGEILSGIIWVKQIENKRDRYGVILHEALHSLVPIRHSNRLFSMMGRHNWGQMSPMDVELIKLNYHPLLQPGMTMDEVRELVVLTDELLDAEALLASSEPLDPLDLIREVFLSIADADGFSYSAVGDSCGNRFGIRRGPIRIAGGDLSLWGDATWAFYDFHTAEFYAFYDDDIGDWRMFGKDSGGEWTYHEDWSYQKDYSSYWDWEGKIGQALVFMLDESHDNRQGVLDRLEVASSPDGLLLVGVRFDRDFGLFEGDGRYTSPADWWSHIELTMSIDAKSLQLTGYEWALHHKPDDWCKGYSETATNFQLGIPEWVPSRQEVQQD